MKIDLDTELYNDLVNFYVDLLNYKDKIILKSFSKLDNENIFNFIDYYRSIKLKDIKENLEAMKYKLNNENVLEIFKDKNKLDNDSIRFKFSQLNKLKDFFKNLPNDQLYFSKDIYSYELLDFREDYAFKHSYSHLEDISEYFNDPKMESSDDLLTKINSILDNLKESFSYYDNTTTFLEIQNLNNNLLFESLKKIRDILLFFMFYIEDGITFQRNFWTKVFEKLNSSIYHFGKDDLILKDKVNFHKVRNIKGFLTILEKNQLSGKYFFRGHSNINYSLSPSILRNYNLQKFESNIIRELLIRCPNEFNNINSNLEKLTILQHYSTPTKLLDLTTNPLVALFFACTGNEEKDAEIILVSSKSEDIKFFDSDIVDAFTSISLLDYKDKLVIAKASDVYQFLFEPFKKLPVFEKNKVQNIFIQNFNEINSVQKLLHEIKKYKPGFRNIINPEDLLKYVIINPIKNNNRIIKQDGLFLTYGINPNSINKSISKYKIIIKSGSKEKILEELSNLGINQGTLFPEIDEVSKYISNFYLFNK